jgi:AmpE protein
MSFVAIFIALLIERFFDCSHLRRWGWYTAYQNKLLQKFGDSGSNLLLAMIVIPIILLVVLLEMLISSQAFGFIKLAFSIFIILYCFGPRNLWADAFSCLNVFLEGNASIAAERLNVTFDVTRSNDADGMYREWVNNIFVQANRRVFATVFWFGCAGLFGVVLYRLVSLSASKLPTARRIESLLDWPAVRVFTFLFALGGNFSNVFARWRAQAALGLEANETLLTECGVAALHNVTPETISTDGSLVKEEISLVDRALVIILIVILVMVYLIP